MVLALYSSETGREDVFGFRSDRDVLFFLFFFALCLLVLLRSTASQLLGTVRK